jgi:hypothetical protein
MMEVEKGLVRAVRRVEVDKEKDVVVLLEELVMEKTKGEGAKISSQLVLTK